MIVQLSRPAKQISCIEIGCCFGTGTAQYIRVAPPIKEEQGPILSPTTADNLVGAELKTGLLRLFRPDEMVFPLNATVQLEYR